jgi:hypothetical protein
MGRPKKEKTTPVNPLQIVVEKQAATLEAAKNKLHENDATICALRDEIKNFKSQTARVLYMTESHIKNVHKETGNILMEDVTYCINLCDRILFNEKED